MAIGIVGDAGVRATAQQPKLFVGMILILIFAEALGLYGLIVALIMSSSGGASPSRLPCVGRCLGVLCCVVFVVLVVRWCGCGRNFEERRVASCAGGTCPTA